MLPAGLLGALLFIVKMLKNKRPLFGVGQKPASTLYMLADYY